MSNDYFDNRKNQKCVQVLESSWFVWDFEVEQPFLEKMQTLWPKSSQCSPMYTKWKWNCKQINIFSNVTAYIMRDVGYYYEDHRWNWWNNDYSPTPKCVFRSFWIAQFTTEWSINESSIDANSSWRPRNANYNCMLGECITSQDYHVSYHCIILF